MSIVQHPTPIKWFDNHSCNTVHLTSFNPKDVFPQWQFVKRDVVTKQSILAVVVLVVTAAITGKRIRKQIGRGTMLGATR